MNDTRRKENAYSVTNQLVANIHKPATYGNPLPRMVTPFWCNLKSADSPLLSLPANCSGTKFARLIWALSPHLLHSQTFST
jgi:hypothetical protein